MSAQGGNPWLPPSQPAPAQTSSAPPPPAGATGGKNGPATAALVIGVLALVLAILIIFAPLGLLLGLIAVVLGIVGLARANRGAINRGHAIAGLVTGGLGLLIGGFITISVGAFLTTNANEVRRLGDCVEDATTDAARDACAQEFADKVD